MTSPFPLSREALQRLKEHRPFFAWFLDPRARESGPGLRFSDPEAGTEREILSNKDVRVTLVTPIDDNADPSDGRLYLRDSFTFDPMEKRLKNYASDFSGLAVPEVWSQVRRWQAASPRDLEAPEVQAFARDVIAFHGRALKGGVFRALKTQRAYLEKGRDAMRRLQKDWTIKFNDPQTHWRVGKKDNEILIEFNFVLDDDTDPQNGRMFWVEQFTLDATSGKMKSQRRDWRPARELSEEGKASHREWEEALKKNPPPEAEEAEAFIQALWPDILHKVPAYWHLPFEGIATRWRGESSRYRRGTLEGLEILKTHWKERFPRMQSEAKGWWQRLQKRWDGGAEALDSLFQKAQALVEAEGGKSPLSVFSRLKLNRGERSWAQLLASDRISQRIDTVSQEIQGMRAEEMFHLVRETFLDEGYFQSAAFVLRHLQENDKIQAMPGALAEIRRLEGLMKGQGTVGSRTEYLLPRIGSQIVDFAPLGAMMVMPFLGTMSEALLFAKIGNSMMGSVLGIFAGISLEAATFATAKNFFASFNQDPAGLWNWKRWEEETASTLPFFIFTRFAHSCVSGLSIKLAEGSGRVGRWVRSGERAWEFPAAPTGRIFSLLERPVLGRGGRRLIGGLNLAAGAGAAYGATLLSRTWRQPLEDDGDAGTGDVFNFMVLYGQALLGSNIGNSLLGRPFSFLAEVQLRAAASIGKRAVPSSPDEIARLFRESSPPKSKMSRPVRPYREALTRLYGSETGLEVGKHFADLWSHYPGLREIFHPGRLQQAGDANEQMAVFEEARTFLGRQVPLRDRPLQADVDILQTMQAARRLFNDPTPEQVQAVFRSYRAPLRALFGNDAFQGAAHFAGLFRNFPDLLSASSPETPVFSPERLAALSPGEYMGMWEQATASQPAWVTEEIVQLEAGRKIEELTTLAETKLSRIAVEGWALETYRLQGRRAWALSNGVNLAGSDEPAVKVYLPYAGIHSHHFHVEGVSDGWVLTDLGGSWGTLLNGVPLAPHAPAPLKDRALIATGENRFHFLSQEGGTGVLVEERRVGFKRKPRRT